MTSSAHSGVTAELPTLQARASHERQSRWAQDFLQAVVVTVIGMKVQDAAALEPILAEASPSHHKDYVAPAEAFVDQFRQEVRLIPAF